MLSWPAATPKVWRSCCCTLESKKAVTAYLKSKLLTWIVISYCIMSYNSLEPNGSNFEIYSAHFYSLSTNKHTEIFISLFIYSMIFSSFYLSIHWTIVLFFTPFIHPFSCQRYPRWSFLIKCKTLVQYWAMVYATSRWWSKRGVKILWLVCPRNRRLWINCSLMLIGSSSVSQH